MKKTFTTLLLSLCISSAFATQEIPSHNLPAQANWRSAQTDLSEDEKIMGFYNSDELPQDNNAIGFREGNHIAGAIFPIEVISGFAGGEITRVRIGLASSIGTSTVQIYDVNAFGDLNELQAEGTIEQTKYGWNEVTLNKPMPIKPNTCYMITYTYKQYPKQYPLFVDKTVNPGNAYEGAFKVKFEGNNTWTDMGVFYGNLCIQAVVKGGNFADCDVTLSKLKLDKKIYKKGSEIQFSFNIKNSGNTTPNEFKLNALLDNNPVEASFENLPATLETGASVNGTFKIPETLEGAHHTFGIEVAELNGEKPVENVHDDVVTTDISTYKEAKARQKCLVECYTSTYCTFCPIGSEFLKMLNSLRKDLTFVCIHADMGSSIDEMSIEEGRILARYMCNGYPSAAYNRYYVEDTGLNFENKIALGTGYTSNHQMNAENINTKVLEKSVMELPSFISIDIDPVFNEETRELSIVVSGEATEDLKAFYGDNVMLHVYLKENNIVSPQLDNGVWKEEYVHNNVLRKVVTNLSGTPIAWESSLNYKNSFLITLPDEWKADDIQVVAFIGPEFQVNSDARRLGILNAEEKKPTASSNIQQAVGNKGEATEVARYTIDGRRITSPVKGINLIKMSDGTCIKEFVK